MHVPELTQEYVNQLEIAEPKYYDRVPMILDYLTYIDEEKDEATGEIKYVRKRLTAIQKEIYRVIKQRAGSGVCFRTQDTLAEQVECSVTSIIEAKRVLQMAFEQLEGKSLIKLEEKRTTTLRDGKAINKKPVHVITVLHIWNYNNAFMSSHPKEFPPKEQPLSREEAEQAIAKMSTPSISELVHNSGASSKNRSSRNGQSKNGSSPPEGTIQKWTVNKYQDKNHVNGTDPTAKAVQLALLNMDVSENFASEAKSRDTLEAFGFNGKALAELLRNHDTHELTCSFLFLRDKVAALKTKNQEIKGTLTGYYLQILKNRWWMPKLT